MQDRIADANSGLDEALVGIETVQTFNAEAFEGARYRDKGLDAKGLRPIVEARMAELLDG